MTTYFTQDDAFNFIRSWYGNNIPTLSDRRRLIKFCMGTRTIIDDILAPVGKQDAKITLTRSETAYTDCKDIFIPTIYFAFNTYEKLGIDWRDEHLAVVAAYTGSSCHEALHIRYTDFELLKIAKLSERGEFFFNRYGSLWNVVINIGLDIYIEAIASLDHKAAYDFIMAKNAVFFNGDSFVPESVLGLENERDIAGAITMLKYSATWEIDYGYLNNFREIMLQLAAGEVRSIYELHEILVSAMDELLKTIEGLHGKHGLEKMFGQDWPDDEDENPLSAFGLGDVEALLLLMMLAQVAREQGGEAPIFVGLPLEAMGSKLKTFIDGDDDSDDEIFAEFSMTTQSDSFEKSVLQEIPGFITVTVANERPINLPTVDGTSWRVFARQLKFIRSSKRIAIVGKTKGSDIIEDQLHNIAIDGRIMGDPVNETTGRGQPEVIYLIDLSGSTNTEVRFGGFDGRLYQLMLANVEQSYVAIKSAGIACAVYGHTSTYVEKVDTPVMIGIAASGMNLFGIPSAGQQSSLPDAFKRAASIDRSQNYDGLALSMVANYFTSRRGAKVLLYLSDGAPYGEHGYKGAEAVDHTTACAAAIRRRGIQLYSISVVPSVVERNNLIYGPNHNIKAYGSEMASQLQRIVTKVVR